MDDFTIVVAAARLGAVSLAARSPWTNVVAPAPASTGQDYALRPSHVLAAGSPDARRGALRPVQVPQASPQLVQRVESAFLAAAELLPMTTETVTFTRKPKNVHKTRINAGGYGAMGPYPEREPLA